MPRPPSVDARVGGAPPLPLPLQAVLRDDLSAVPGDAPMVVWTDPATLRRGDGGDYTVCTLCLIG